MSTPSSAKPAAILTIPLIYPQYNSLIHLSNIAMHFHNSHPTVSSLNIIYIPAYYSHSPLPHELISDGTRRVSNFSTSFTSIPNQALLDHHCTHITRKFGAHWKLFSRQLTRTQQFLRSLDQHPSAPTQLLTTLQLELSNIQDMYKSSKTTITSAINLLNSNQLQTRTQCKQSLLPFLGAALSWLTGTATTKDIHSIKTRINQLIATQTSQCSTLVHIVLILNVTRYATQVNRHSINNLIDAICTTSQDINNLYNLTTSLAASINFNQMVLHIRSVFANL